MAENYEQSEPSANINIPSLDEALHQSEASNSTVAENQNPQETENENELPISGEPSIYSEISSMIPTSPRLSIATTHQSTNVNNSNANISETLDAILSSPGWNVAAQAAAVRRRNSLMSTRSLQPTLPPYEEYRYHLRAQDEAGPSGLRPSQVPTRFDVPDRKGLDNNEKGDNSPRTPEDPENTLSAHYSGIVRTIDSRYTLELERMRQEIVQLKQAHAEESALMRNDMDAAYRGVLKKRDREVEKVKEEAASRVERLERDLEEVRSEAAKEAERVREEAKNIARRTEEDHRKEVERERHVVEDEWERRWLGRMQLSSEEAARREEKGKRDRDEEWIATLGARYPDLVDELTYLISPVNRTHED
ncbi:MAG: hypothetical protein Q9164_003951 [Protoblastenia rupestris]